MCVYVCVCVLCAFSHSKFSESHSNRFNFTYVMSFVFAPQCSLPVFTSSLSFSLPPPPLSSTLFHPVCLFPFFLSPLLSPCWQGPIHQLISAFPGILPTGNTAGERGVWGSQNISLPSCLGQAVSCVAFSSLFLTHTHPTHIQTYGQHASLRDKG